MSALKKSWASLLFVVGCAAVSEDPNAVPTDLPKGAETYWLTQVGWGKSQNSRVCARGNQDPVALRLCANGSVELRSLEDLQRVFWPRGRTFRDNYFPAITHHSQSLVGRTVSALTPRVILSASATTSPIGAVTDVVMAFVRGEQFVELLGVDGPNKRLNFYLLAFGHACHHAGACTTSDLIGPRLERDWTSWTLYQDEDLEDTGFSCLSCHQPDGPGTPKRFLMRQEIPFWMHWGAPFGSSFDCADGTHVALRFQPTADATHVLPDLAGWFAEAHTGETHYAGEPISLFNSQFTAKFFSGMAGQVRKAVLQHHGVADQNDSTEERFAVAEPHPFSTPDVLREAYCEGKRDYWNGYRDRVLRQNGFPIPYHQYDVLDEKAGPAARADFAGFLSDAGTREPFDVLSSLMSEEAAVASGFLPDPATDAPTILTQMCVRCHTGKEPSGLRRARFNARQLDQLSTEARAEVIKRIRAPRDSPEHMPPRRSGDLPSWAIERIEQYLTNR